MKKIIVGSLVGAILLFSWQGISWMVMGLHEKEYLYTPAQDSLLASISSTIKEDGQYSLPNVPPGASKEARTELNKKMEGKPWVVLTYHSTYDMNMAMQMVRGFLIGLVCVWLCCMVIGRQADQSFMPVLRTTLTFGVISFLFVWYIGHNFGGTPWSVLRPELIDDLISWGLTGIWLGWWYGRK